MQDVKRVMNISIFMYVLALFDKNIYQPILACMIIIPLHMTTASWQDRNLRSGKEARRLVLYSIDMNKLLYNKYLYTIDLIQTWLGQGTAIADRKSVV